MLTSVFVAPVTVLFLHTAMLEFREDLNAIPATAASCPINCVQIEGFVTNPASIHLIDFDSIPQYSKLLSMCGIVGYIGPKPVVPVIIEGLRRLEYRGYDSAGIAVAGGDPNATALSSAAMTLEIRRAPGKLAQPGSRSRRKASPRHLRYRTHRWATHGRPTEENAHPHRDGTVPSSLSTTASSKTTSP